MRYMSMLPLHIKEHYAKGKYQATDVILDSGHGEGFVMGNILKYWKRYGNKEGKNRKDLLKIIHYAIIMLYVHDHINKRSLVYAHLSI